MTDTDLGTAVIVYDDPDEGTVEKRVENESIAYFQDHWIVKLDEDAGGNDVVRRIPIQRVHYVERSVEEFETEVKTLRNQVESFAKNLQSSLLGGGDDADTRTEDPQRIEVEDSRSNE
ncbi:hypothetical protein C5B90_12800 [Haloferax sp. Atlit-12N]|uniref:hypothetical protein n=1 Tax=Haloferax sp. Atlit-12N TaxID=2077203 RepID=UPI000E27FB32|nr:hypothetical protein [Haloferax sp. Atlit-12N]RDZ63980.1 hypothetical protein C5B90_12800 [Haloferax sp. Atlit-12N]